MKRAKKILAVLLSMAMVLGMSATAFAEGNPGGDGVVGTRDDRGTITIQGVSQNKGPAAPTVTAYKIVSANYSEDGKNFLGYEVLDAYKAYISVANDGGDISFTEEQLTEIANHLGDDSVAIPMTAPTTWDGSYSASDVAVGSYLVLITGAEATIYNPMVVSVYYESKDGGNVLSGGNLDITSTKNAWAKSTTQPTIDKNIVNADGSEVKGNSVSVGDTISYSVNIAPIPYYGGEKPVLYVTDKLSAGLVLQPGTISVKVTSANGQEVTLDEGTDYTVATQNIGDASLSVNFVVGTTYTLNKYVQEQTGTAKAVITYDAKLTGDNVSYNGTTGNTNEAVVNFTRDSSTTGNSGSDNKKTYTYTFDIGGDLSGSYAEGFIHKIDGDSTTGGKKYLANAEFTLYKNYNAETNECSDVYKNEKFTGTTSSNSAGLFDIKGLEAGTYYLKETKAPTNYSLNDHVYVIVIDAKYENDGQLKEAVVTIDGDNGAYIKITQSGVDLTKVETLDIPNTKLSSLPSTGGIGTTIFTVVGCIVMIGAAGLFFASRRKKSA